jgi:hypothetical protein
MSKDCTCLFPYLIIVRSSKESKVVSSWTTQVEAKQSWARTMQSTHSKGLRIHTDIMESLAKPTFRENFTRPHPNQNSICYQRNLTRIASQIQRYFEQHKFFEVSAIGFVFYRRTGCHWHRFRLIVGNVPAVRSSE